VYGATVVPGMPGYVVVAGPKGLDWTGNDGRSWTNLSGSAYWAVDCISLHACWAVGPRGRITSVKFEPPGSGRHPPRSEEHTSELQSRFDLVCRLLLEKKK